MLHWLYLTSYSASIAYCFWVLGVLMVMGGGGSCTIQTTKKVQVNRFSRWTTINTCLVKKKVDNEEIFGKWRMRRWNEGKDGTHSTRFIHFRWKSNRPETSSAVICLHVYFLFLYKYMMRKSSQHDVYTNTHTSARTRTRTIKSGLKASQWCYQPKSFRTFSIYICIFLLMPQVLTISYLSARTILSSANKYV